MKKRSLITLILYIGVLALLFSWVSGVFGGGTDSLSYSQLVQLFQDEQVRNFTVDGQMIYLELYNPYNGESELVTELADPETFRLEMQDIFRQQSESGVLESYHFVPQEGFSAFDLILPLLIAGGVLLLIWFLLMSKINSGGNPMSNFGRARTVLGVPDGKKVTFEDVAGADEEKQELQEVVDFCWLALPVPVRHCLPGQSRAKRMSSSFPFPVPTLWNCM